MTITQSRYRWVEGAGLVLGPPLLLAGVLARTGESDFFPGQLAAYAARPGQMLLFALTVALIPTAFFVGVAG
ncbi:hypothetical protein [Nonomuraea sp. LPB2021202275-12-8]|uniref:hypothetical protein n=1 Tax=Nonomuraea sp. LPB2021202275-12-8 TaxID=3120159 RepID=UPI00300D2649